MQTGINGYEIYKNVGIVHAVVFADRAPEAKNAQVIGETQNSKGLKKRKNSDRNGQKSDKSKSDEKKCSFWGRLGGGKVKTMIESAWSCFSKMCSPPRQEQHFLKKYDAKSELEHENYESGVL